MEKKKMTNIVLVALVVIVIVYCFFPKGAHDAKPRKVTLKTHADSLSYALGYIYGIEIQDVPFEFKPNMFFSGLLNAPHTELEVLTHEQIFDLLARFQSDLENLHNHENMQMLAKNREAGRLFMEENALKSDVKTTNSGLQYRVITAGNGRQVRANSSVVVHYTGRRVDGQVFDSSYLRGDPMTISIDMVIDGWGEGLLLMREGDVFELVIPYHLAFGERGEAVIEPGETLIFEIELLQVVR